MVPAAMLTLVVERISCEHTASFQLLYGTCNQSRHRTAVRRSNMLSDAAWALVISAVCPIISIHLLYKFFVDHGFCCCQERMESISSLAVFSTYFETFILLHRWGFNFFKLFCYIKIFGTHVKLEIY